MKLSSYCALSAHQSCFNRTPCLWKDVAVFSCERLHFSRRLTTPQPHFAPTSRLQFIYCLRFELCSFFDSDYSRIVASNPHLNHTATALWLRQTLCMPLPLTFNTQHHMLCQKPQQSIQLLRRMPSAVSPKQSSNHRGAWHCSSATH